jgi:hypothetical protein
MNEDKLNAPPDQPPVLSAVANENVVDTSSNTKSSRLGIWSLGVSIVSPILILIIFFTFIEQKNVSSSIGYSFFGIIIYPIISIILSVCALASGEQKSPAIIGLILSIIGGVGLILFCVLMIGLSAMP